MSNCEFAKDPEKTIKQAKDDIVATNAWSSSSELQIDTAFKLLEAARAEQSGNQAVANKKLDETDGLVSSKNSPGFFRARQDSVVQSNIAVEQMRAEILDGRSDPDGASKHLQRADKLREDSTGLFGMSDDSFFLTKISSKSAWAEHYDRVGKPDQALSELKSASEEIEKLKQDWRGATWEAAAVADVGIGSSLAHHYLKNGDSKRAQEVLSNLHDKIVDYQDWLRLNADTKVKLQTSYLILQAEMQKKSGDCQAAADSLSEARKNLDEHSYHSLGDLFSSTVTRVGRTKVIAALGIAEASLNSSPGMDLSPAFTLLLSQHYRTGGKYPSSE